MLLRKNQNQRVRLRQARAGYQACLPTAKVNEHTPKAASPHIKPNSRTGAQQSRMHSPDRAM